MNAAKRCKISDDLNVEIDDKQVENNRSGNKKNWASKKERRNSSKSDKDIGKTKNGSAKGKRDRDLPECLNYKCSKRHFVDQCEMTSEEEAKILKKAYHEWKKKRKLNNTGKGIQSISNEEVYTNTSLFSGTFCGGVVDASILADSGSDCTAISEPILSKILAADPLAEVILLKKQKSFHISAKRADPIKCNKSVIVDVELRVRHRENLLLRRVERLVSIEELSHAYIGRHLLAALGIDTRTLMAAARDRFGSSVNVEAPVISCRDDAVNSTKQAGQANSILEKRVLEYSSTYHSSRGDEEDNLNDCNVYIDLGEDDPSELSEAIRAMLSSAKANGLSEAGMERLTKMLNKYRKIFRIRLGKSAPPRYLL